jgi:signal transduction histidine kinase
MAMPIAGHQDVAVEQDEENSAGQAAKSEEYLKFVNLISHELGGPTAVLGGYLSMWLDGTLGELPREFRKSAEISYGKVVQLKNLINQMLLAARIHDQALVPNRIEVDLVTWLREAARDIAFAVSSTGQALQLDVVPRSLLAEIEPELLRSAVFNLVDNAQKFSPPGAAIRIRLGRADEHAEIEVVDEGLGLPEEFSLEPFARHDRQLGFDWPGVGLGVFIARGVAQAHGGDLDYRTSTSGTTMRMRLPALGEPNGHG